MNASTRSPRYRGRLLLSTEAFKSYQNRYIRVTVKTDSLALGKNARKCPGSSLPRVAEAVVRITHEQLFNLSRFVSWSLLDLAFSVAGCTFSLHKFVQPDPVHRSTDWSNSRSIWSGLTASKRSPHTVGWSGNNGWPVGPEWSVRVLPVVSRDL